MDYIDRVIIKLRRQYDRDEVIAALNKQLAERDIEIGQLKSEVEFLQNELLAKDEQKEINKLGKIEARKNELYMMKIKENQKLQKEVRDLRKLRDVLMSKIHTS